MEIKLDEIISKEASHFKSELTPEALHLLLINCMTASIEKALELAAESVIYEVDKRSILNVINLIR